MARIVSDLIIAAADTTSISAQWLLHFLAQHPEEQDKILADLRGEDAAGRRLRWCLKESMRLYPVAPFLTRILPNAIVLGPHMIPAGQVTVISLYAMGRDSKYFEDPDRFWPERWERQMAKTRSYGIDDEQCPVSRNPSAGAFASLPFGFGRRACIGRRLAEDQLTSLAKQLITRFEMKSLNHRPLEMIMRMTGHPSQEIQIGLQKRDS